MTEMPRTATGDAWQCRCGFANRGRTNCPRCGLHRSIGDTERYARKEWEEERDEALEEIRESRNDLDLLVDKFCVALGEPIPVDAIERAKQLRTARARDAEALTTATDALRGLVEACEAWFDPNVRVGPVWPRTVDGRAVLEALTAIDHLPQSTTVRRLATATEALKAIAAPEHRMPDDWAAMVATTALKRIGEP